MARTAGRGSHCGEPGAVGVRVAKPHTFLLTSSPICQWLALQSMPLAIDIILGTLYYSLYWDGLGKGGDLRVISEKTLRTFWKRHPTAEKPLQAWLAEAKRAHWASPAQIKTRFPNASIIRDNRLVFNIGGTSFRLAVWINYAHQAIYVKWFGTHTEYDRIDVERVEP